MFAQTAYWTPGLTGLFVSCDSHADCADTDTLNGPFGDFGPWTCGSFDDLYTGDYQGDFCVPLTFCEGERLAWMEPDPVLIYLQVYARISCKETACEGNEACSRCLEMGFGEPCLSYVDDDSMLQYEANAPNIPSETTLPPLKVDPDSIVFTGFSSGSWMSHQMHVIFSS